MTRVYYALSVKQPWAALIAAGLKTIEVRSWATQRRGFVLIHASRQVDERPEAWKALPESLAAAAKLSGGIIGCAELVDCVTYRSRLAFLADRAKHLNHPDWFRGPVLYGFQFARPRLLRFRKLPGWFKFFPVRLSEIDVAQTP